MKIERFEDLRSWQEARVFNKALFEIISKNPEFIRDYGLRDQIQRASVSIMSNIAEGFDCDSDAEFLKFLGYSRRSGSEVQSQLYNALDRGYLTQEQFDQLYDQVKKVKELIGGLSRYLKMSDVSNVRRK